MKEHLNTLFITAENHYLHLEGTAIAVMQGGEVKLRVPLGNLCSVAIFAWDCTASAALLSACAQEDISVSFHTPYGKFQSASRGFTKGNIYLRRNQYRLADTEAATLEIARLIIAAKIANSRHILMRSAREQADRHPDRSDFLSRTGDRLRNRVEEAMKATFLDGLRGIEGEAASLYFEAFPNLLLHSELKMEGRSRRPPEDPVNALLSFCYTLLMNDCRSALESCGLDPQCGFLHRDRPGRPSLALDLMEEFRPILADRTALALINRKQISEKDFETHENGGVYLKPDSRKTVLLEWQQRKQTEIHHPLLGERISVGLLPFIQARLLARHIRGDLEAYPAYLTR